MHGIRIINNYCEPIYGFYRLGNLDLSIVEKCDDSNSAMIDHLAILSPEYISILNRWTFRLFPIEGEIVNLTFDNEEGGVEYIKNYHEFYAYFENKFNSDPGSKKKILRNYIEELLNQGIKIKLVYPIPEAGWNMSKYNMNNIIYGDSVPEYVSTNYDLFVKRNKFAIDALDSIQENTLLQRIKPDEIFCNVQKLNRCSVQINSRPLYYDSDHLSNKGAELLINQILAE
jgi:hypothetical protein